MQWGKNNVYLFMIHDRTNAQNNNVQRTKRTFGTKKNLKNQLDIRKYNRYSLTRDPKDR